jgi:hypothetical protein
MRDKRPHLTSPPIGGEEQRTAPALRQDLLIMKMTESCNVNECKEL